MIKPISITAISSISALGRSNHEVWQAYLGKDHLFQKRKSGEGLVHVAALSDDSRAALAVLTADNSHYKRLDDTVLLALYAARKAIERAGWEQEKALGINIGSSRGATGIFEKYYEEFLNEGHTVPLASPTSTLGNISSWVAHDLQTTGPEISHSITCSTALHALLNGIAWINSGMAKKFLVGGSEAPLTSFTISQMKALKIYSKEDPPYPCKASDLSKKRNSMVLGEGAALACIEGIVSENSLAIIEGVGYATEPLEHSVSMSTDAFSFQRSMKMALGPLPPSEVNVVVMHSPGTILGDHSEYNAIQKIFGSHQPLLTTNKWKLGHTLGASGMFSLEMGVLMLQNQLFIPVPFFGAEIVSKKINRVMINAVGFGGNAVSILIKHPTSHF